MARLVVHIGTHKTGTTSFQRWCRDHADTLRSVAALSLYRGVFPDSRELGAIAISSHRDTPGTYRRRERGRGAAGAMPLREDPEWESFARGVSDSLAAQYREIDGAFVVSSESLSLLREPGEMRTLRSLLPDGPTEIVVCLRRPEDFLRSWSRHLRRDRFALSKDPASFAYVSPDSWLVDYPSLLALWRTEFGHNAVHVIDYDEAVARHGSTIPALAQLIAPEAVSLPGWEGYRFNASTDGPRRRGDRFRGALRRQVSPRAAIRTLRNGALRLRGSAQKLLHRR